MLIERCCEHCGQSFAYEKKGGRLRKYCDLHVATAKRYIKKRGPKILVCGYCKNCGDPFVGTVGQTRGKKDEGPRKYCSKSCADEGRTVLSKGPRNCEYCGIEYVNSRRRSGEGERFCGRPCSDKWLKSDQGRLEIRARMKDSTRVREAYVRRKYREHLLRGYRLRPCIVCGTPGEKKACNKCAPKVASYLRWESLSKGRVHACTVCRSQWCNMYGETTRSKYCSGRCAKEGERNLKRKAKSRRRSRIRLVSETISRIDVFSRDKWTCQGCGCHTPRSLMGKNQDNSPELDHVVALANGGTHTYDNVQTLCRVCNILKADKSMDEFLEYNQGDTGGIVDLGLMRPRNHASPTERSFFS